MSTNNMVLHPLAELFPPMPEEDFQKLKANIDANGLFEMIVLFDGKILDGRHRYRACVELDIEPNCCELDDDADPMEHVLGANLHRRHLSETQRSVCSAKARDWYDKEAKKRQKRKPVNSVPDTCPEQIEDAGDARDKAGEAFGVSGRSVDRASKAIREGTPELTRAMERNEVPVSTAANFVDNVPDKKEQAKIVKQGVKAIKEAAKKPKAKKEKPTIVLPDEPTSSDLGAVDRWLNENDERPALDRFVSLWEGTDEVGRVAIRVFVTDETP